MTALGYIDLTCPNCGHTFPVIPVRSIGSCRCGLDFDLDPAQDRVVWTPDANYPQGGTTAFVTTTRGTPTP